MKKYSFKFQSALDMREKKLEDKKLEMAETIAQLNEQNRKLEKLVSKKEPDILEISSYKNYMSKIFLDRNNQAKAVENISDILRFKQLEVSNALEEVKAIENLKENKTHDEHASIRTGVLNY
ncbi:MAG: hypothetical protein WCY19_05700 [Candidatus Gastranaerophilaceae bacterium]